MGTETNMNGSMPKDSKSSFGKTSSEENRADSSGHKGNASMDWKTDVTNDKHADQAQKKEHKGDEDHERKSQFSKSESSSPMNSPPRSKE